MKVIIHSIGNKYVMDTDEYMWLLEHVGQPIDVFGINYVKYNGVIVLYSLSVHKDNGGVFCLFNDNDVEIEFVGALPTGKFKLGAECNASNNTQYQ